jgi:hypothetical protein
MAMPFLSWQDIVVGDPLCSPFQSAPAAQDQLHRAWTRPPSCRRCLRSAA